SPVPVRYWEVGNEVYGAKPSAGAGCAPFGWEDVWTCDGSTYVNGDSDHDGFLAFRSAMQAVDPTILVGAVGVARPNDWSNWGTDVINATAGHLDFYSIHEYGFGKVPDPAKVAPVPFKIWPTVMSDTEAAFAASSPGGQVPIAVTEYNLAAMQDDDPGQLMTKATNALFLADMIGQMAVHGVVIANQWNLLNGRAANGTDYGMISADNGTRSPQFYALVMWAKFGETLVPVTSPSKADELSVYASTSSDGSVTVLAVNKTGQTVVQPLTVDGWAAVSSVTIDALTAPSADATTVSLNGSSNATDSLAEHHPQMLGGSLMPLTAQFAPHSITVLRLAATGKASTASSPSSR
ncbi:MAG: alpha-L-arabinofuranosidase, partial [Ilumatobacteraceae bacterium]